MILWTEQGHELINLKVELLKALQHSFHAKDRALVKEFTKESEDQHLDEVMRLVYTFSTGSKQSSSFIYGLMLMQEVDFAVKIVAGSNADIQVHMNCIIEVLP